MLVVELLFKVVHCEIKLERLSGTIRQVTGFYLRASYIKHGSLPSAVLKVLMLQLAKVKAVDLSPRDCTCFCSELYLTCFSINNDYD